MLNDIPDEVTLHWIAKFLGIPVSRIYELNKAGLGPHCTKKKGRYVVAKKSLLLWLSQVGNHAANPKMDGDKDE